MELAVIIAALLVATGAVVVLTGLAIRASARLRPRLARCICNLAERLEDLLGQAFAYPRGQGPSGLDPAARTLVLRLLLGLAAVALAAVGLGKLVDDVTGGDGVALLDHPVAVFVTGHRAPAMTSVMKAVSLAGGPTGMTILALAAGLVLAVTSRSWMPVAVLAVTAAGVVGLTVLFKDALGRARPPLAQAVAAADGYGFPSGHAAAAAAVCGAVAWLCTLRLRSWRTRLSMCVAAAMVAALVGISRVYLGVHWTSDVLGGWAAGTLWAAVVVSAWAAYSRLSTPRR
jgi:undecaprenyl-diphosphatase